MPPPAAAALVVAAPPLAVPVPVPVLVPVLVPSRARPRTGPRSRRARPRAGRGARAHAGCAAGGHRQRGRQRHDDSGQEDDLGDVVPVEPGRNDPLLFIRETDRETRAAGSDRKPALLADRSVHDRRGVVRRLLVERGLVRGQQVVVDRLRFGERPRDDSSNVGNGALQDRVIEVGRSAGAPVGVAPRHVRRGQNLRFEDGGGGRRHARQRVVVDLQRGPRRRGGGLLYRRRAWGRRRERSGRGQGRLGETRRCDEGDERAEGRGLLVAQHGRHRSPLRTSRVSRRCGSVMDAVTRSVETSSRV